jgi:hypothetical protein
VNDRVQRNWLLFATDLFLDHQSDDDLNRWLLGGDCLGWIYARLLADQQLTVECCPFMEDWGWYASVRHQDSKTSVCILLYSYIDKHWLLGLKPRHTFSWSKRRANPVDPKTYVAFAIDGIIADTRFRSFGWREDENFEILKRKIRTNNPINPSGGSGVC